MQITLTELEAAINYWRAQRPSIGEELALSPEVNLLSTPYALMIFSGMKSISSDQLDEAALQLVEYWQRQR
jgi:Protein of unknown function (DUF3717)